jgi:hypothetical protein
MGCGVLGEKRARRSWALQGVILEREKSRFEISIDERWQYFMSGVLTLDEYTVKAP